MHAGFCSTEVTGSKEAILDGILSNGRGYCLTWELSEHCSQKSPLLSNVIFFSTYALNFVFGGCRGRVLLHSTDWPGTQRSTCYASQVMGLKVCILLTGSSEFLFEGIQTLDFKALPSVFPEWLLPSHSHLEKRGEREPGVITLTPAMSSWNTEPVESYWYLTEERKITSKLDEVKA